MATMLREQSEVGKVIDLADAYANAFVAEMRHAPSEEVLREALAGTLISYLAEVLATVKIEP